MLLVIEGARYSRGLRQMKAFFRTSLNPKSGILSHNKRRKRGKALAFLERTKFTISP